MYFHIVCTTAGDAVKTYIIMDDLAVCTAPFTLDSTQSVLLCIIYCRSLNMNHLTIAKNYNCNVKVLEVNIWPRQCLTITWKYLTPCYYTFTVIQICETSIMAGVKSWQLSPWISGVTAIKCDIQSEYSPWCFCLTAGEAIAQFPCAFFSMQNRCCNKHHLGHLYSFTKSQIHRADPGQRMGMQPLQLSLFLVS